jgi:multidrug efflux pump subunit AcrA (membrane-fusion protein)
MGKFLENMQGTFEALANAQSQLAKAQADAKKAQADQVKKEKQAQKDAEAALKSRGKRLRASIFTSEEGVLGPPTAARSKVFAT